MTDIIRVDENDKEIGVAEKLKAHEEGWLHRAFSVFVYRKHNNTLELLLQKRHPDKYHSGGLWTNACCGHPYPCEGVVEAGERRLKEEMGIAVPLHEVGVFHYKASVGHGLIENEIDHVLIGEFPLSAQIQPDAQEISDYCWVEIETLRQDVAQNSANYTVWLPQALRFVSL